MKRTTWGIAVAVVLGTVMYGPGPPAAAGGSSQRLCADRAGPADLRGATITVDWDGSEDYTTIQEALDASTNGDTIIVMPSEGSPSGAYVENIDFPAKAVTLRGSDPDDPAVVAATIIDGNSNGSVVTFETGATPDAILAGFTIRGGRSEYGGGLYCTSSSPTIDRCTISGNSADYGGGMTNRVSSSPTLAGCSIYGNSANLGGGVYNFDQSSPTLVNCTIGGNSADYGGGVYNLMQCDTTLTNCIFSGNVADSFG